MFFSKSKVASRLSISLTAVKYLINHGYLQTITNSQGKEVITQASLIKELARRHQVFSDALEAVNCPTECACGCRAKVKAGSRYITGHDAVISGILKFIVETGHPLDRRSALNLAKTLRISLYELFGVVELEPEPIANEEADLSIEVTLINLQQGFLKFIQGKMTDDEVQMAFHKAVERSASEGDHFILHNVGDLTRKGSTGLRIEQLERSLSAAKSMLGKYVADEIEQVIGERPDVVFRTETYQDTF
ncbi:hypothetical protein [Calidifontibacillus oryziterrae]|uniref:hypothetical protein n=1 Tax=Calidifontibacillus oryziterrae TaxID=1191699 RepID=UPI0002E32021|nr:hypothetical protein [Calidifontibacillus oryziterrae]